LKTCGKNFPIFTNLFKLTKCFKKRKIFKNTLFDDDEEICLLTLLFLLGYLLESLVTLFEIMSFLLIDFSAQFFWENGFKQNSR
jgi:hypothetical protein